MSVIAGKNLLVYVQGDGTIGDTGEVYPIGCDRTCTLVIQSDMIETTIKDNGYNKTFLPTTVSYQISGDGLTDFSKQMGAQSLQTKILNRTLITFKFQAKESDTEAIIYSGQGYLQDVQINGPANGVTTYSYQLIGTGALEIDNTIPVSGGGGTPADDMAQVYRLQFIATDSQTTYQNNALTGATLLGFWLEDHCLYNGTDSDEMAGLTSSTGTLTWNYEASNGMRAIIIYKK